MNEYEDEKLPGGEASEPGQRGAAGIDLAPVDDEFADAAPPLGAREPAAVVEPEPVEAIGAEPEVEAAAPPTPAYVKSVFREYFESMVVTFIMAIFGMTFITQAVKVPTGSMLNTILIEDHLMVNKFIFGEHPSWLAGILPYREIQRGDIIVFKYPLAPETNYVKRVIGLPGETIEVYGSRVYINGKELPEDKVLVRDPQMKSDLVLLGAPEKAEGARWTAYYNQMRNLGDRDESDYSTLVSGDMGEYGVHRHPYTIPAGTYFCMGDNRDNSEDSRVWGTVPRENVVGRAMFVYWSLDMSGTTDDDPTNFFSDFVGRTRWGRTGTLIK